MVPVPCRFLKIQQSPSESISHAFHVEGRGVLRFLQSGVDVGAVLDLLHGYTQVSAQHVVEGALLDRDDLGAHCGNILINGLVVEERNAFAVDFRLAGADAAGDHAALAQRFVIGLLGAAEGVGQELLGQVGVLAVAGDIQGGSAVGGIAFAAVQGGHGGDLPLAGISLPPASWWG